MSNTYKTEQTRKQMANGLQITPERKKKVWDCFSKSEQGFLKELNARFDITFINGETNDKETY